MRKQVLSLCVVMLMASAAMAGTITPVTLYSSSGFTNTSYPASNLVNGNQKDFALSWTGGSVVLDLGTAMDVFNVGINGRNAATDDINGVTVSVFDNDDPTTGTLVNVGSWNGLGSFAVNRGQIAALTSSVNKRYVQVSFASGTSHGTQIAEITVNQDVIVSDASGIDVAYPLGDMADNNPVTWGRPGAASSQSGYLILDTGNPADSISGLTLTARNASANLLPKTGTVKASNDPSSFLGAAIATFNNPTSIAGGTNDIIFDSNVSERYLLLEWDSIQPGGDAQARFADIDLVVIPEPVSLVLLGMGSLALMRRRKLH